MKEFFKSILFPVLLVGSYSYEASGEGNSAQFLTATAAYEDMNYWFFFSKEMAYSYGCARYTIRCLKN